MAHVLVDAASITIGALSLLLGSWVVLADPATATPDMVRLVELVNGIVRVSIAGTIVRRQSRARWSFGGSSGWCGRSRLSRP